MPQKYILPLRSAVEKGKVSMEVLNQRVREVLYVKFWLGVLDIFFSWMGGKGENKFMLEKVDAYVMYICVKTP
jgi:hypothetical protein